MVADQFCNCRKKTAKAGMFYSVLISSALRKPDTFSACSEYWETYHENGVT